MRPASAAHFHDGKDATVMRDYVELTGGESSILREEAVAKLPQPLHYVRFAVGAASLARR